VACSPALVTSGGGLPCGLWAFAPAHPSLEGKGMSNKQLVTLNRAGRVLTLCYTFQ